MTRLVLALLVLAVLLAWPRTALASRRFDDRDVDIERPPSVPEPLQRKLARSERRRAADEKRRAAVAEHIALLERTIAINERHIALLDAQAAESRRELGEMYAADPRCN